MPDDSAPPRLTRDDFKSDQAVRWCPGCGDYAILAQVQRTMPDLHIPRENIVFISGIGCSSRFPYYMNTYGFHTIHGRAPTFGTGLKMSRPDLSVWLVTGDGDGLSIGGNHFIHVLRRNIDLQILLFNNRIYGLTKGQASPTSELGKITKSSPFGTVDQPFRPLSVALGTGGTFVARSIDREPAHLASLLKRSAAHKGTAFLEIFQNCNIFNDGAFADLTDRKRKADTVLKLEHGKPLLFGKNKEKGIRFNGFTPEVVEVERVGLDAIAVHDEQGDIGYHFALAQLAPPHFPTPIGVIRAVEKPCADKLLNDQLEEATRKLGPGDLHSLLHSGVTWTVK